MNLRNKEARTEKSRARMTGDEAGEATGGLVTQGLVSHQKEFGFHSEWEADGGFRGRVVRKLTLAAMENCLWREIWRHHLQENATILTSDGNGVGSGAARRARSGWTQDGEGRANRIRLWVG